MATYVFNILKRQSMSIAPSKTVLIAPIDVTMGLAAIRVEVINDDLTQTLDVRFEKSELASGPWSTSDYAGLLSIEPGETRTVVIDARFLHFVRLVGVASGAGLLSRISVARYTGDSSW